MTIYLVCLMDQFVRDCAPVPVRAFRSAEDRTHWLAKTEKWFCEMMNKTPYAKTCNATHWAQNYRLSEVELEG